MVEKEERDENMQKMMNENVKFLADLGKIMSETKHVTTESFTIRKVPGRWIPFGRLYSQL